MEFRKVLVLRGPNYWANFPVLEAWVDLGPLKDSPSDTLPGFNERLMAWLPTMIEHRCSVGERGGFFERLRRGTYQGHILEHVAARAANAGRHGSRLRPGARNVRRGRLQGRRSNIQEEALGQGRAWNRPGSYAMPPSTICRSTSRPRSQQLRKICDAKSPGPQHAARSCEAAVARGIPVRRLNTESLVQFGYGLAAATASWPPRPTAPAPSPKRSPRTRN